MRILAALALVASPKPASPARRARDAAEHEVCPRRCMRARGMPLPLQPSELAPYGARVRALECQIECLKQRVWHTKARISPTMSACVEPLSSSP